MAAYGQMGDLMEKILVVEDDPDIQELLNNFLREAGYETVTAGDGVEALDLYHDFYPHKTWEDWALHTIDGIHPNETGRDRITQAIAQILEPEKAF